MYVTTITKRSGRYYLHAEFTELHCGDTILTQDIDRKSVSLERVWDKIHGGRCPQINKIKQWFNNNPQGKVVLKSAERMVTLYENCS